MQINATILTNKDEYSLLLKIEDKLYVFNMFEGFQRKCFEHKISISKLSAVFSPYIENMAGLTGTYLTLADAGVIFCDFISEYIIDHSTLYTIAYRPSFKFLENQKNVFSDTHISVKCITVNKKTSFTIDFKKVAGKFQIEKLSALFPKNKIKNLKNKEKVNINGIMYDGKDYCEDDILVSSIFVCYSKKYHTVFKESVLICDLIFCYNKKLYKKFERIKKKQYKSTNINHNNLKNNSCKNNNNLNYHINIIWKIFYFKKEFQIEFLKQYEELLENKSDIKPITKTSKESLTTKTSKESFTIITSKESLTTITSKESLISKEFNLYKNCMYNQMSFYFNKQSPFIFSDVNKQTIKNYQVSEHNKNEKNYFPKDFLLFLGTGCAVPSKTRNVSSLLFYTEKTSLLFDCGEDTFGQAYRCDPTLNIISNLNCILLSHSHADHILGTCKIIKYIYKKHKRRIHILCSQNVNNFIQQYVTEYVFIDVMDYVNSKKDIILHEYTIKVEKSDHFMDSVFYSVYIQNFHVTYSGDCRPSCKFIEMSKNCDVMVHEATYNTEKDLAEKRKHSTEEEAKEVFYKSKGKYLILTHFSNRNTSYNNNINNNNNNNNINNITNNNNNITNNNNNIKYAYDYYLFDLSKNI